MFAPTRNIAGVFAYKGDKKMSVMRVHKTKDYTIMSNAHFREKEMTLKAKGLLSLMLSLPDEWNYSIAGLCAICVEKESAIKSTLNELKKFGYLTVEKFMPNETESGRIEYVYNIFEFPQNREKQPTEKQGVENQGVENPLQYNTNNKNTNNKINNIKESKKEREEIEHPIEEKLNTSAKNKKGSFDTLIDEYCKTVDPLKADEIKGLLQEWLKVRKAKRAAMTDKAIELNLKKLNEYASESNMTVETYLEEVIMRGWQAFYPIKEYGAGAGKQGEKKTVSNNPFLEIAKERGLL